MLVLWCAGVGVPYFEKSTASISPLLGCPSAGEGTSKGKRSVTGAGDVVGV